ncbi:MAG: yajR [Gammaproteobacteria bacterium]|jgi:MFS family permease|nr:yajR [Gammaproteobacteria bacterium]
MTRSNSKTSKMNPIERQAVFSLSTILCLRMLGLFMALPLFALYASHLSGATPLLIGLSMGIYGLVQALLQIPFGALSDHVGRKKIIALGLCIFAIGSMIAALSHTIWGMLLGRALQGAGAVGSTIIALIADLTRTAQRTKAMAISGITIGLSFSLAMILGPITAAWLQVNGIFWLAALLSIIAIILLFTLVPTPGLVRHTLPTQNKSYSQPFLALLKHNELKRLNSGIFLLHFLFTASFVAIPISLQTLAGLNSNQQWMLYLPALIISFLFSIACIAIAEKKHWVKPFFIGSIILIGIAEFLLWIFAHHLLLSALSLLLFFSAFSLLEAFLPSLVSRAAPPAHKGMALGIYSCSQFLGIFAGGTLGGWLYGTFGLISIYLFCTILALVWSAIAFNMKNPQYSIQA